MLHFLFFCFSFVTGAPTRQPAQCATIPGSMSLSLTGTGMNCKTVLLTDAVTDTNELSFAAAHGLTPGTAVVYSDNSETTITGLTDGTTYYVLAGTTASKMKLEASLNSGAIAIAAGQGASNNKIGSAKPLFNQNGNEDVITIKKLKELWLGANLNTGCDFDTAMLWAMYYGPSQTSTLGKSGMKFVLRKGTHHRRVSRPISIAMIQIAGEQFLNKKNIGEESINDATETILICKDGARCFQNGALPVGDNDLSAAASRQAFPAVIEGITIQCESETALMKNGAGMFINGEDGILDQSILIRYTIVQGCQSEGSGDDSLPSGGAAMFVNRLTSILSMEHVKFLNNVASEFGGALYMTQSVQINIKSSTFEQNTAGRGGAIAISQMQLPVTAGIFNAVFDQTTFKQNEATIVGGATYIDFALAKIDRSTFDDNTAATHGGAIRVTSVELEMTSTRLVANHATSGGGGALDILASQAIIQTTAFERNVAFVGGALRALYCKGKIEKSSFRENKLHKDSSNGSPGGGSMYLGSEAEIDITEVTTYRNSGETEDENGIGGDILVDDANRVYITLSEFTSSEASAGGGCVAVRNTLDFTVSKSVFYACETAGKLGGGALYVQFTRYRELPRPQDVKLPRPTIEDTFFIKNVASSGGGGAIKWEVDPSMAHLSLLHNPIEDSTPDDITDDTYRPTVGGPIRLSGYGPGGSDKAPYDLIYKYIVQTCTMEERAVLAGGGALPNDKLCDEEGVEQKSKTGSPVWYFDQVKQEKKKLAWGNQAAYGDFIASGVHQIFLKSGSTTQTSYKLQTGSNARARWYSCDCKNAGAGVCEDRNGAYGLGKGSEYDLKRDTLIGTAQLYNPEIGGQTGQTRTLKFGGCDGDAVCAVDGTVTDLKAELKPGTGTKIVFNCKNYGGPKCPECPPEASEEDCRLILSQSNCEVCSEFVVDMVAGMEVTLASLWRDDTWDSTTDVNGGKVYKRDDGYEVRQCPFWKQTQSKAKLHSEQGGKPFDNPLDVELLDYYNHRVTTSEHKVVVTVEADMDASKLGMGLNNNCTSSGVPGATAKQVTEAVQAQVATQAALAAQVAGNIVNAGASNDPQVCTYQTIGYTVPCTNSECGAAEPAVLSALLGSAKFSSLSLIAKPTRQAYLLADATKMDNNDRCPSGEDPKCPPTTDLGAIKLPSTEIGMIPSLKLPTIEFPDGAIKQLIPSSFELPAIDRLDTLPGITLTGVLALDIVIPKLSFNTWPGILDAATKQYSVIERQGVAYLKSLAAVKLPAWFFRSAGLKVDANEWMVVYIQGTEVKLYPIEPECCKQAEVDQCLGRTIEEYLVAEKKCADLVQKQPIFLSQILPLIEIPSMKLAKEIGYGVGYDDTCNDKTTNLCKYPGFSMYNEALTSDQQGNLHPATCASTISKSPICEEVGGFNMYAQCETSCTHGAIDTEIPLGEGSCYYKLDKKDRDVNGVPADGMTLTIVITGGIKVKDVNRGDIILIKGMEMKLKDHATDYVVPAALIDGSNGNDLVTELKLELPWTGEAGLGDVIGDPCKKKITTTRTVGSCCKRTSPKIGVDTSDQRAVCYYGAKTCDAVDQDKTHEGVPGYYSLKVSAPSVIPLNDKNPNQYIHPDPVVRLDDCDKGTYLNQETLTCNKCDIGRYSDKLNFNFLFDRSENVNKQSNCLGEFTLNAGEWKVAVCTADTRTILSPNDQTACEAINAKWKKICTADNTVTLDLQDTQAKCEAAGATWKDACVPDFNGVLNPASDGTCTAVLGTWAKAFCSGGASEGLIDLDDTECALIGSCNMKAEGPCMLCSPGQFQDKIGSENCKLCPKGTSTEKVPLRQDCQACDLGKTSPMGAGNCTILCKIGEGGYMESDGSSHCKLCFKGRFSDKIALPTQMPRNLDIPCIECGLDADDTATYAPNIGMDECLNCPVGYFSKTRNDGDWGPVECKDKCQPGTYKSAEMSKCEPCNEGTFQDKEGMGLCKQCTKGRFQKDKGKNYCERCPPGQYQSATGSTKCLWCTNGKYAKGLSADNRHEKEEHHKSGEVDELTWPGYAECAPCEQGTFQPSTPPADQPCYSEDHCKQGGFNGVDMTATELKDKFDSGVWIDVTQCKMCAAGYFTNGMDGESTCSACPIGRKGSTLDKNNLRITDIDGSKGIIAFPRVCPDSGPCYARLREANYSGTDNSEWYFDGKPIVREFGSSKPEYAYNNEYRTCFPCLRNFYQNGKGNADCKVCNASSWTNGQEEQDICTPCVRGEIFPGEPGSDCEACTSVDRTKIGNRGHYSFSKGERVRECHSAPGGMFSDGYDVMRVEYGWWLSRGSSYDKESVIRYHNNRPSMNPDKCDWLGQDSMSKIPSGPAEELIGDPRTMNEFVGLIQCGRDCTHEHGNATLLNQQTSGTTLSGKSLYIPNCQCETNSDGVLNCKVKCKQDVLKKGLFMDACSVPRVVQRCFGFQRRTSCPDLFDGVLEQFPAAFCNSDDQKESSDFECPLKTFQYDCTTKCESSEGDKKKVCSNKCLTDRSRWTKYQGLSRRVMYDDNGNTRDWSGEFPGTFTIRHGYYCAKSNMPLDFSVEKNGRKLLIDRDTVVINGERFRIEFNILKASAELFECADIIAAESPIEQRKWMLLNARYLGPDTTQAIVVKDPLYITHNCEACRSMTILDHYEIPELNQIAFVYTMPLFLRNTTVYLAKDDIRSNILMYTNYTQCDILNGYTGRLCQACLPGWARRGQYGCMKCPPVESQMALVIMGAIGGLFAMVIVVYIVISDAGSTSTASTLKRIILNHMQLVSICMNFDLNWTPAAKDLFTYMGYFSSIGEQLIQADCILNEQTRVYYAQTPPALPDSNPDVQFRPFYIIQLIYTFLAIGCIVAAALFWLAQDNCHSKHYARKEQARVAKNVKRAMEQLDVRRDQIKNRWKRAKNSILQHRSHKRIHYTILSDIRSRRLAEKARKLKTEMEASGVEDPTAQDDLLADREAIARLRAREFMKFVKANQIDLKLLFKKYAPDSHHAGEMELSVFVTLLKSLGMRWPEEDYECVADLFDSSFHDGRVHLSSVTGFNKTAWDNFVVTCIVIMYLLYPTIASTVFKQLACSQGLNDLDYSWYLVYDMQSPCYSPHHLAFLLTIGLPTLIVYIFGFPIIGLYLMHSRIKRYGWQDDTLMYRYAMLLSGYRHEYWWWELVTASRKVTLIGIGIFGANYGTEVQFFLAVMVIVFCLAAQAYAGPYSNQNLNHLENYALLILFLSLYLGLLFFWETFEPEGLDMVAYMIITLNVFFGAWCVGTILLQWAHRHSHSMLGEILLKMIHKVSAIIALLPCCGGGNHENPFVVILMLIPIVVVLVFSMLHRCCSGAYCKKKKKREKKKFKSRKISVAMSETNTDLTKQLEMSRKLRDDSGAVKVVNDSDVSKATMDILGLKEVRSNIPEDLFTWHPDDSHNEKEQVAEERKRVVFLQNVHDNKNKAIEHARYAEDKLKTEKDNLMAVIEKQDTAYRAGLKQVSLDRKNFEEPSFVFRAKILGTSVGAMTSQLPYNGDVKAAMEAGDVLAIKQIMHHEAGGTLSEMAPVLKAWKKLSEQERKQLKGDEAKESRKNLAMAHDEELMQRKYIDIKILHAEKVTIQHEKDKLQLIAALKNQTARANAHEKAESMGMAHAEAEIAMAQAQANAQSEINAMKAEAEAEMKEAHRKTNEAHALAAEANAKTEETRNAAKREIKLIKSKAKNKIANAEAKATEAAQKSFSSVTPSDLGDLDAFTGDLGGDGSVDLDEEVVAEKEEETAMDKMRRVGGVTSFGEGRTFKSIAAKEQAERLHQKAMKKMQRAENKRKIVSGFSSTEHEL